MNAKTTSAIIIIGTLVLGILIGSLATSAIMNNRLEALQALRMQDGLTRYLQRIIEPTDEKQKAEVRAILQQASRRQAEIRRSVFEEHRTLFEEMRNELDVVLTAEQKEKLKSWIAADGRAGRVSPEFMRRRSEGGRFRGHPPYLAIPDSLNRDSLRERRAERFRRMERLKSAEADSTVQ